MKKISYGKHSTRENVQLAATKLKTDKGPSVYASNSEASTNMIADWDGLAVPGQPFLQWALTLSR